MLKDCAVEGCAMVLRTGSVHTKEPWVCNAHREPGEWMDHYGHACPVIGHSGLQVKLRNGEIKEGLARDFAWNHEPLASGGDIVAYRFREDVPAEDRLKKCIVEGCEKNGGPDGPHCAHHYFNLSDADLRKGWEAEQGQGMKFDQDKPRMDLLDAYATEELAKVLTFGAKKYAPHNWRKGISYARLIAAALRHIYAFARGEDHDPETGLPHPAHAMCCMMFLIWMMKERRDQDDRWKAEPKKLTPQQMKDLLYGKEK